VRTKSAQVDAVLANPAHTARVLVTAYDSGGAALDTWGAGSGDLAEDPVLEVDVEQSIDSFRTARVKLQRQHGRYSLAPLVTAGNPLFDTESVVNLARRIVIEAELQLPGITATPAGLKVVIFDGWIDEVSWPGDEVELVCTDGSAKLRDTWIERERVYGFAQGVNAVKGCYSWSDSLQPLVLNDLVIPSDTKANGHFYKATTVTGLQLFEEPTWPTGSGATVVSGGVTLTEAGAVNETGVALETLITQVIADNGLSSFVSLNTPVSPGWAVKPYIQGREAVMPALQTMVDQLGWCLRFEWNAGASRYDLTLAQPARTSTTVHRVFRDDEEIDCTDLGVDVWDIRNVVRVLYGASAARDAKGDPTRFIYEASDAASIAKYGRRFMELGEATTSVIDTAVEAARLANAVLSDLMDPTVGVSVSFAPDFWLELGDRITLPSDGLRWTTGPTLAIESIKHRFSGGSSRTAVTLRGKPAARRAGWLVAEGRVVPDDVHQLTSHNTVGSAALKADAIVGGGRITYADLRSKGALNQAYEYHLSESSGFTCTSATLVGSGEQRSAEVSNLVPGKTYYGRIVPCSRNASRIVRGPPSAEVSFVAGRASAGHLDSLAVSTVGGVPNGKFTGTLGRLVESFPAPPDHWTLTSGTWGSSSDAYALRNDTSQGTYLELRQTGTNAVIRSSLFTIARGARSARLVAPVRPQGTLIAGRDLQFHLEWFGDEGVTTIGGGTEDVAAPYNIAAAGVWAEYGVDLVVPAGAQFARVSIYKTGVSSAYGWDIGGVFLYAAPRLGQPEWTAPTFATNWGDVAGGWMTAAYLMDTLGFVRLRGLVKITTATLSTPCFTLPAGLRPSATLQFPVRCGTGVVSYVSISSTGAVTFGGVLADGQAGITLDGINFDTR
jgi:hypothetical protein